MRKIKTAFERDWGGDQSLVIDKVLVPLTANADSNLYLSDPVPTVKFDGTAVLVQDGVLFKRYDCKKGRTPPESFMPAQEKDEITGHWPGWIVVDEDDPANKWYFADVLPPQQDGTYEFIGPKVNGNNECRIIHWYIPHGASVLVSKDVGTTFAEIKEFLTIHPIEGIVWWYGGKPIAKIKRSNFGIPWSGTR